jgi:hypothetical protein
MRSPAQKMTTRQAVNIASKLLDSPASSELHERLDHGVQTGHYHFKPASPAAATAVSFAGMVLLALTNCKTEEDLERVNPLLATLRAILP